MFFARTVPLELAESHLRGLRISLNTPVVSTEELAVGPARAGLLVHLEPDGRPNVTVGIRSLRSGEVVLYSFEGDLREHSSLDVGIDAGLSFAESMGFLFDEDELGDGDGAAIERCMGLWTDLMGSSGAGSVTTGPGSPDAPSEPVRAATDGIPEDLEPPGLPPLADATPVDLAPGGYVPQFDGDLGGDDALDLGSALDPDELGVDLGVSARSFEVAEGAPEAAQPGIVRDLSSPPLEPTLALDLGVEAVELGTGEPRVEGPGASVLSEDPVGSAAPGELEASAAATPEPATDVAAVPPVGLSKFRASTDSSPSAPVGQDAEVSGRTELARVRLVRRGGGSGRPHPIIRLLGAF